MTDLPSPPFITVAGVANFRDAGGYPCSTSASQPSSIRRGLIFRSADFNKVQPDGLKTVKDLGIRKVFDLRSAPEIKSSSSKSSLGSILGPDGAPLSDSSPEAPVERIWVPVFAEQDYGPDQVARRAQLYGTSGSAGFVQAYRDILVSGIEAFRTILTHLASESESETHKPGPEPCVIHCTAGKDRTGVIIALLLLLCGVSAEVVAGEYALTEQGLAHLKPAFVEKVMANPEFEGGRAKAEDMISSKKENMLATLGMLQEVYGGAERYVREVLGMEEDAVARLRRNVVCEDRPVL